VVGISLPVSRFTMLRFILRCLPGSPRELMRLRGHIGLTGLTGARGLQGAQVSSELRLPTFQAGRGQARLC